MMDLGSHRKHRKEYLNFFKRLAHQMVALEWVWPFAAASQRRMVAQSMLSQMKILEAVLSISDGLVSKGEISVNQAQLNILLIDDDDVAVESVAHSDLCEHRFWSI